MAGDLDFYFYVMRAYGYPAHSRIHWSHNHAEVWTRRLPLRSRALCTGTFDCLPVELMHEILSCFDFRTLGKLRLVNYGFKHFVDSLVPYKYTLEHAQPSLRALVKSGSISSFNVTELYAILTSDSCALCGGFGPFFSPLTRERCCLSCAVVGHHHSPPDRLRVFDLDEAKRHLGLTDKDLKGIPTMLSAPRPLNHSLPIPGSLRRVVTASKVWEIALAKHGSDNGHFGPFASNLLADKSIMPSPDLLQAYDSLLWNDDKYDRVHVTIGFPTMNWEEGAAGLGEWCLSCLYAHLLRCLKDSPVSQFTIQAHKAYRPEAEILQHLDECSEKRPWNRPWKE
ncbi:hypothetical protein AJ80_07708 [Polytolypa hystricis UAMH7299]|uniref:F-box domain-containing protein n=1 Tax=Polytolypa hystricis (strain UAMH7299) TaxID=1447883 RepID=A0A2B7XKC1_POLH7|nr:hypothetical protein AJ80_07708 [Polytolypa hystricis UAMH7299]